MTSPPSRVSRRGLFPVVVRPALTLVLVFVLVDAFVFVEPGVSRMDHLASGLIPVAILAAVVMAWDLLPGLLRGTFALVLGVLALVGGFTAVSSIGADVARGDDWVGLVLLPAGIALVAAGIAVLWTTRRRDGSLAWRILRRALLAVAALFVVYWVVLPAGMAVIATERPPGDVDSGDLGRPSREVAMQTADGLELHGTYVAPRNGAAIILFPRESTEDHARMLVSNGYGVLLLDMRGYGTSEGDPNAYGWGSDADIAAGVAFLEEQPDVDDDRIGGLGLSVGGEQMIEASAGNEGLRAVVSEGAGTRSARESFVREGPNAVELVLQYPFDLVQTGATAVLSGTLPPPSLEELAGQISPRALFLVYGEQGQDVEPTVNKPYFAAAGEPKELWEVPGAGHTGGLDARPEEYEARVVGFFDRELLGE